ncbi:hypothetical protein ACLJJ6_10065 [Pediococcus siamensis]|uniref:hypothetical protein n=1 Tax=Pediococcus siamensis TaxID=381829 RepID=UPI0039A21FFB
MKNFETAFFVLLFFIVKIFFIDILIKMVNQRRALQSFQQNIDFIRNGGKEADTTFSFAASDLKLSKAGRIALLRQLNQVVANFKDPDADEPQLPFNLDMVLYSDQKPKES